MGIEFASKSYTGDYDWISGVTVAFSGSATYGKRIEVGLNESVDGIGPGFTEVEATINAAFGFNLSLEWGHSGATYNFEVTQLELDADVDADLVIPFLIGDLEASMGHPMHTLGAIDLKVHVDVNHDTDEDEYVVEYDPVADPVSSLIVNLPVFASIAGVDVNQGPEASIGISGDLFLTAEGGRGSTAVAVSSSNLESFVPFVDLRLSDIEDRFESIRDDFLGTLSGSDSFNIDIPFVDATLSDVLDLGVAFDLAVLSKIDFEGLGSLQDLVAEVTLSGLIPDGEAITYNPVGHVLTIPLDFDIDLGELGLRDLDLLGRVNLQLLEDEGLVQIGAYIDPDDLIDNGYVTLADLWSAGVLDKDSVSNWDGVDKDALIESGVISAAALTASGLVRSGDVVDLDDLIDAGLAGFADLVEAEIITAGSLVANLGFIRDINLMATNVADLGLDLASQASVEDLVDIDGLLSSGLTTLENLFDTGLLDLGDINLDSLGITDLLSSGIVWLRRLTSFHLRCLTFPIC